MIFVNSFMAVQYPNQTEVPIRPNLTQKLVESGLAALLQIDQYLPHLPFDHPQSSTMLGIGLEGTLWRDPQLISNTCIRINWDIN